jgi:hypothetical protein
MIPKKDYYVDAGGKITNDPEKYAIQVAVAGVLLDERIARRYGIDDTLVSVDEPGVVRSVRSMPEPEKETESEPKAETPEDDPAAEPQAKKGAKKKS